jgi:predicted RNA binding protein YcfA (HicA-like mRNA interferase family)
MPKQKIVPIHFEILVKIFELEGFVVQRKKGDHIIMTKSGVKRPVVIKTSPKLVPVTHIRTNITTAGMTRERYFELLERVG